MSTRHGRQRLLFVGDDWAEEHHDVEMQDETGRRLAKARAARGRGGHRPAARADRRAPRPTDEDRDQVLVGIETDRGPWVQALVAAGYRCSRSTRCRWPATASGTACPAPRATPATRTCWPTWSAPTPTSCARSPATATRPRRIKVVARAHKTLIWERTRHLLRLRARAARVLPRRAGRLRRPRPPPTRSSCSAPRPDPAPAAALTSNADHRGAEAGPPPPRRGPKAEQIQAALRAEHLGQPPERDRRLRRHRARPGRADRRVQHRDQTTAGAGRGPFWPAPGR